MLVEPLKNVISNQVNDRTDGGREGLVAITSPVVKLNHF